MKKQTNVAICQFVNDEISHKFNMLVKIMLFTLINIFFILTAHVSANSIKSIDMDVYIDNEGNATITEVWNTELTEGTEGYRTYKDMGNSVISNFSVTDQTGTIYERISNWNRNSSFDSKAYKCGIHDLSDGVELCWGISNYGDNTYTLKYNISNLVTQYTDKQGIYFNFLNLGQTVLDAKITIHSTYKFSGDNAKIWSFGNDGTISFNDGNIILKSLGKLPYYKYMVGLVRFENNLFNTSNTSSKSFEEIYDSAMSTVSKETTKKPYNSYQNQKKSGLMKEIGFFIILIILYINLKSMKNKVKIRQALDLGPMITPEEITYFRDIPCGGDLYYAYWIMMKFEIMKENECKNAIIGAILLKWVKEGYIELSKTKKGIFNFKNNNYAITFKNINTNEFFQKDESERYLMRILKQASEDNILEADELENWCNKNYFVMNYWFNMLIEETSKKMQKKGLLKTEQAKIKKFWRTETIITTYVDPLVRKDALNLLGLRKFLLEYTLISDREHIEVHILENYLVFAQLLGIADKVEEQFSKLCPDFYEISNINIKDISFYTTSLAIGMVSNVARETLREERRRASGGGGRFHDETTSSFSDDYRDDDRGGDSYSSGGRSAGGSSGGGFR